ncbi:EscU/YscU/HrcU family type III secretion system export apparatus switch protein [Teichococcus aestuarii]|uniref:EscU/YscU/HrcU family type III secretion system export apparatus switch protein n=1 Tax=Teichococcus aestuarii TaxID=568898 RepID=UPI0036202406
MAEEQGDADDKQLDASQRRLDRAREQGDVPLAREAVQLASLAGGALALGLLGPALGRSLIEETRAIFAGAHMLRADAAAASLLRAALPLMLAVAAMAALGAVAGTLLQTRLLVSAQAMAPKLSKISPLAGAKRLFGPHGLQELARALLKLGATGLALWWVAADALPALRGVLAEPPEAMTALLAELLGRLVMAALAALAVLAAADFLWVRLRFARRMRMSLQEMKEEMKESDGDPHLRAKRRARMLGRRRRRVQEAVPKATVVVTNPTHYAVALAYDRAADAAPRVVARGVDAAAARIRRIAEAHGVPLVANPPLARALYRLEEEAPIPPEHFQAVAELIALVWRMRGPAAR